TLRKTFAPLGKTVSALYGSVGASSFDTDALNSYDIVVATPEKLDFAIRNDADILNNVGLVVLDEGHMIGLNEREIRYEVQIQKLLKRPDADERRIVCLSAVLSKGGQFNDFVQWIRRDKQGEAISSDWRPTRRRFGKVLWQKNRANLEIEVGQDSVFKIDFFGQSAPTNGRRTALFPRDQGELVLATAWRLVKDEHSVLIFSPRRDSVEKLAREIVDLTNRGFLTSVLKANPADLVRALAIGKEWLGEDHPVLKCLSLGIGVHHGRLPKSFRKEIERLLKDRLLKIIISSPTLAQGLNLTATAIVIHTLQRTKDVIIPFSEFQNVIGRAGRAFVDVEGLVLFPIFKSPSYWLPKWQELTNKNNKHSLKSGLVRLVETLLDRLRSTLGNEDLGALQEYVLNNARAWEFTPLDSEDAKTQVVEQKKWEEHITFLDTAVLGLIGDENIDALQTAEKLDEVLQYSLWQKCLQHEGKNIQELLAIIEARTKLIWGQTTPAQRKGYFLAGVGLESGRQLDEDAERANQLLMTANSAILNGDESRAIAAIILLARIIFAIPAFAPKSLPNNWRNILQQWLRGRSLVEAVAGKPSELLGFIEEGLIYKLSWGMEAIKIRAQANGDTFGSGLTIEQIETGLAFPAIETGTLNRSATILMQAGFTFRSVAIQIVNATAATFENFNQMNAWLESDNIKILSEDRAWPSIESHDAWVAFTQNYVASENNIWDIQEKSLPADWFDTENPPPPNTPVKLINQGGETFILSATLIKIGRLIQPIPAVSKGVLAAKVAPDRQSVVATYYGSENLW
ncbi:MAG: DEAD/DEAH box helicase, partial [Proteobacteria bacterium]|nr:DEAD/DEAH box helicase [Pseudomonadota bacterium]